MGIPSERKFILEDTPFLLSLSINRELLLNDSSLWDCAQCDRCDRRCPQEVSPYLIIKELRNESYQQQKEHVPKGFDTLLNILKETGRASKPQAIITEDFEEFTREDLGLPPLPELEIEVILSSLTELGLFKESKAKNKELKKKVKE